MCLGYVLKGVYKAKNKIISELLGFVNSRQLSTYHNKNKVMFLDELLETYRKFTGKEYETAVKTVKELDRAFGEVDRNCHSNEFMSILNKQFELVRENKVHKLFLCEIKNNDANEVESSYKKADVELTFELELFKRFLTYFKGKKVTSESLFNFIC